MRRLIHVAIVACMVVPSYGATSRAEMLRSLAECEVLSGFIGTGRVAAYTAGHSVLGQSIPVVVVRDPNVPSELTEKVFVICRQHGDEPASTEAALSIIGAYFAQPEKSDLDLLSRVSLVIVPMMNPDGAARDERRNANNADLNRDWIRQSQPETTAVAGAIELWRPALIIDAHELDKDDPRGDFIESLGRRSGIDDGLASESAELQSLVISKLRTKGLTAGSKHISDRLSPRLAHRYFPLRHGIMAILVETRQSGARAFDLQERVRMHITSMMTAARYVAGDADNMRREIADWHNPRERVPLTYRGGKSVERGNQ